MTEEDIKIKYVLAWLKKMGVDPHELQCERSFSLKIGRQFITVGHVEKKSDSVGGRLDILVRRNGRNLLIIETKADGLQLTNDDRDQAISYARLVHPIAPYAVVTNGQDYQLYDAVTKALIDPKEIQIGRFEAALPDEDIHEAQSLFLALNPANLIAFCRSQIAGELRIVKGSLAENKKYIPELHVPRETISREVMEFYNSPLPGLLLTGQSGSGKTCEMCWFAESLLNSGKPVLFFNGIELEAGVLDAISAEFSWAFNSSELPVQVVRRMAKLAGNEKLTIVIDAIDEWIFSSRENNLGSLLRAAENNNIKLIVSCKTSAITQFISARGNQTNIDLLTKKIEVEKFSDKEFYSAVEKYRQTYQFYGAFENMVLDEARSNPFMLRVLFDVAKHSNLKHITFSSAKFFETYFYRSVNRTLNARHAENTLKVIAEVLYQNNVDWIQEDEVRPLLNLGITDSIMEELFEYGILLRSETNGSTVVGFYFQQLRDYLVAFKACKFNAMSQQQLTEAFELVKEQGTRADVFHLYYRLASTEHQKILDREIRKNAAQYLKVYTSLIQQHFPSLRTLFKPQTEGRIGFIGELLLVNRRLGCYGFRALGETDDEVHFVPVQQAIGKSNLAYLDGADQLHLTSGSKGFRDGIDVIEEVIDHELLPQLEQFLKDGTLNESQCPEMLLEFITESILANKAIFKEILNDDGQSIKYPVELEKIRKLLLREKLSRHYRDDLISSKRRSGEIEEIWDGGLVSYSTRLTVEDENKISDAIEDSLRSGSQPTLMTRYTELNALESSLERAINQLSQTQTRIESLLYKNENKLKADVSRRFPVSHDNAKRYLQWLYSAFLENYKCTIETNFPTLKKHFCLYAKLPVQVHLVLGRAEQNSFARGRTSLDVYFSPSQRGTSEVAVVEDLIFDLDDDSISVGGVVFLTNFWCKKNFENLFCSMSGRSNDPFRGMTLRRLVYQTIESELKSVKKQFRTSVKSGIDF